MSKDLVKVSKVVEVVDVKLDYLSVNIDGMGNVIDAKANYFIVDVTGSRVAMSTIDIARLIPSSLLETVLESALLKEGILVEV